MNNPKTAAQLQKRQKALQRFLNAGDSFAHLLTKPAILAERAASRKKQPTFLESLTAGVQPDCSL